MEMAYGLSNSHVTDDVTWPWKVKFVTPIRLERNRKLFELETSNLVCRFVSGMPSGRTNNYPESGRGLGHVTPTIYFIRSNISLKLLELETSNLIHGFVLGMPSRRINNFPESRRGLGHVTLQFLAVRSAILATAWLLVFHGLSAHIHIIHIICRVSLQVWQFLPFVTLWDTTSHTSDVRRPNAMLCHMIVKVGYWFV